jgi:urease accessory protein
MHMSKRAAHAAPAAVSSDVTDVRLLRLLQLSSATLPVGAYAYSHGLEQAASRGWVTDEATLGDWTCGLIEHALGTLDVPVLGRLCNAWRTADEVTARRWMKFCSACRESGELALEEHQLGTSLARVLTNLGIARAAPFTSDAQTTYLGMYALAVVEFDIEVAAAANALLFAWTENQVGCATRLLPLGQLAAQRVLSRAVQIIPRVVDLSMNLADDELCSSAIGLGIASALHETQYCRLFRS